MSILGSNEYSLVWNSCVLEYFYKNGFSETDFQEYLELETYLKYIKHRIFVLLAQENYKTRKNGM